MQGRNSYKWCSYLKNKILDRTHKWTEPLEEHWRSNTHLKCFFEMPVCFVIFITFPNLMNNCIYCTITFFPFISTGRLLWHGDNCETKLCTCNITEKTEVSNTGIYVVILALKHHSANCTYSSCDAEGRLVNSCIWACHVSSICGNKSCTMWCKVIVISRYGQLPSKV